jgi:hypothetical protein
MRIFVCVLAIALDLSAQTKVPKIWDDKTLEDWATPIAALSVRPGQFTSGEYYAAPVENLKTYPVYRPDREPARYWEWLRKQKPQPLVDVSNINTREDWIKAGDSAFRTLVDPSLRRSDPESIQAVRNIAGYDGVWTMQDGSLSGLRWVVTERGIELGFTACAGCHHQPRADGTIGWGVPLGGPPAPSRSLSPRLPPRSSSSSRFVGDSRSTQYWRTFTVPWAPDPRIERFRDMPDAAFGTARSELGPPIPVNVWARNHGSPYFMTKIPDLNNVRFSSYMDATGTHKLRGPEDIARYAAFVSGADPMEFGSYRILAPEQRRITFRFADEVLYAIGQYLMSLEPARNPDPAPPTLIARGREIFSRETCVNCHVPPNYTSGKLTLAQGFTPPADHPNKADIINISVGTDPGLAMRTRKGTGFYKIPSLRGLWYRPLLLHDGSVASLEEMFDPDRLKPDHVPGGWKGPGVTKRAIPGHPFGLGLTSDDKKALLAFLRSL